MAKRNRGNGQGTLFQRKDGGNWLASWWGADGTRIERSTRTTCKADAERIMRKWVERTALEREGLVAPEGGTELDRHAAATIESHLAAFESAKRSEGRTDRHAAETVTMIREASAACGWTALGDMSPEALERFIGRKLAPVAEEGETPPRPWSPRTAHKYVTAFRTFARWCVADGRLAADPLARVKKPTPTRQRSRRMLSVEEWRWLKPTTEHGPERMGMDGHARRLLYELAIQTGFRSSELRALTRSCLMLDADRPYALLEARRTKNRKAARQYLRPELARELAAVVARMMPGAPVFAMPRREHVAAMLRADLQAAREAWLAEARGGDRVEREKSDFLQAEDHDGRTLDFHALRHTTGAWAALGGASPKAIQALMRHSSITLTLDTYGHLLPDEAAETVARMPAVPLVPLRLTGTTDQPEVVAKVEPAVDYATGVRSEANRSGGVRWIKSKNALGVLPRAVFKRGGRDSNPQPPDRQSGAGVANDLESQGFTSGSGAAPAVDHAAAPQSEPSDPRLAGVVEAWSSLPEAVRVCIATMIAATRPEGNHG